MSVVKNFFVENLENLGVEFPVVECLRVFGNFSVDLYNMPSSKVFPPA